ncbi:TerC family protein [Fimbriimonas ginsengisoli]|uniref:Integral membrane protein TerC n=1 Tax=Fimbriimonas ginsengisoli Gsoil 348 TaxID=661478 RepID=A0A068NYE6_FIMGI|nr:TerC family protein [Fimbriimonas ginsengisoli]AIE88050.1 integral membrane protein TerC [Fimbriimonas ginsengisoli Gsoil 348]
MFGQTFQTADIASIAALVMLEAMLSGDNALVLAIMVRHLPKEQRQRALLYGLGGAFAFRLVAILLANAVLKLWWLQAVGAGYLIFLPIKHFVDHREGAPKKVSSGSFWHTVVAVELTDIAFAMDSVLAGVSFVDNRVSKIWVVYTGAIVGMILLRFAAGVFVRFLEKYPFLDHVAYLLVGWVGTKLMVLSAHNLDKVHPSLIAGYVPEMPQWMFWSVLGAIALGGSLVAVRKAAVVPTANEEYAEEVDEACQIPAIRDPRKPDRNRVE